jgi:hypothetical protein
MDKLLALAVTLAMALPLAGCIVRTHDHRPARAYNAPPRCHGNYYWDGRHCRPRGDGHHHHRRY